MRVLVPRTHFSKRASAGAGAGGARAAWSQRRDSPRFRDARDSLVVSGLRFARAEPRSIDPESLVSGSCTARLSNLHKGISVRIRQKACPQRQERFAISFSPQELSRFPSRIRTIDHSNRVLTRSVARSRTLSTRPRPTLFSTNLEHQRDSQIAARRWTLAQNTQARARVGCGATAGARPRRAPGPSRRRPAQTRARLHSPPGLPRRQVSSALPLKARALFRLWKREKKRIHTSHSLSLSPWRSFSR